MTIIRFASSSSDCLSWRLAETRPTARLLGGGGGGKRGLGLLASLFVSSLAVVASESTFIRPSRGGARGYSGSPAPRCRASGCQKNMSKRDSISAQRNKGPIWDVLSGKVLPLSGYYDPSRWSGDVGVDGGRFRILEVAAGCGVHTEYFSSKLVEIENNDERGGKGADPGSFLWYPTDPDVSSLRSIAARIRDSTLERYVHDPLPLTLSERGIVEDDTCTALTTESMDLILCINMIHISPWQATIGLMRSAGERLRKGGLLYCYGPYKEGGTAVSSNLSFDDYLRGQDLSWGVRNLEDVVDEARKNDLNLVEKVEMPSNNLSLLFRRQ